MTVLRVILGDQLSTRLEIIRSADRANDVILMAEVGDEAAYVNTMLKRSPLSLLPCATMPTP